MAESEAVKYLIKWAIPDAVPKPALCAGGWARGGIGHLYMPCVSVWNRAAGRSAVRVLQQGAVPSHQPGCAHMLRELVRFCLPSKSFFKLLPNLPPDLAAIALVDQHV